jgi:hypothetical protein
VFFPLVKDFVRTISYETYTISLYSITGQM